MLRRLVGRERWYERVGTLPASNRSGLVVMAGVSGAADVGVHYDSLDFDEGSVVSLGCADKQLLEEFCQELDAVDLEIEWVGPIRASSPEVRGIRVAHSLAKATTRVVEAAAAHSAGLEPSGASVAVVIERLGHAAASVTPPTMASKRARDALAAVYERSTTEPAPF